MESPIEVSRAVKAHLYNTVVRPMGDYCIQAIKAQLLDRGGEVSDNFTIDLSQYEPSQAALNCLIEVMGSHGWLVSLSNRRHWVEVTQKPSIVEEETKEVELKDLSTIDSPGELLRRFHEDIELDDL